MPGEITGYKYTQHEEAPGLFTSQIVKNAKISFKGSDSKTVEFELRPYDETTPSLFNLVDKYSTKESPMITPEEVVNLRTEFAKKFFPVHGGRVSALDYYKGLSFLLDTYTSDGSEGGKNITPKEIAHMFEVFSGWRNYI